MNAIKFLELDKALICKIPDPCVLNPEEIKKIAAHTKNTWQRKRGSAETLNNTSQGKLAEFALEQYLENKTNVRYLSYDDLRADQFDKHAPFDGLLYQASVDPQHILDWTNEINKEVSVSPSGQISEALRARMADDHIFTVEIKSSQLRAKDYQGVSNVRLPRQVQDYQQIIRNIKKWDYIVYPHFTRRSDTITSFYEYAEFVRDQKGLAEQSNQEFLRNLILDEFNNACDIYTRLYFDYQSNELFIPGYITKAEFFRNPKIGKMFGEKSGKALYYMRSIATGSGFAQIDHDDNIWGYDRRTAYEKLFGYLKKRCPNCGQDLQICNTKARHVYSYRCFHCDHWFTMDEINEC